MPDSRGESGRSARGAATRRRLLEATLQLIARRGAGAFTVREVVKEAGSSLGVLTYHFPTRHDLIAAAVALRAEREASIETATPGDAASSLDIDLDAATDQVIDLLFELVFERRDDFLAARDLGLAILRDPSLADGLQPAASAHHRALERLLAGIGSAEPELDAGLLATTLEGLGLQWLGHAGDRDFDAKLGRSVRRLLEKFLRDKD